MTQNEILEILHVSIEKAKRKKIDIATLKEATHLRDDLEIDSLDGLEMIFEIEERFHIDIQDDEKMKIATVGDVLHLIESKLKSKGSDKA